MAIINTGYGFPLCHVSCPPYPPARRRQQQRINPQTFSASCSNKRSWKHWSSCSLRTCQAWWRCCRVECSLSSSWVIRGTRPWVSALHIPPLLLLLLPLPPLLPPPLRLEKDSLLCIRCSNLKVEQTLRTVLSIASFCCVARRLHHHHQIFFAPNKYFLPFLRISLPRECSVPAHLCPSVSSSSIGALMTFFFSVACSSIIRLAPSRSWGKSFLETVSCISSSRVNI